MDACHHLEYFDIALAVDNVAREVGFFETAICEFSRVPVHRVLEIACGTAPYLAKRHRRGHHCCGPTRRRR